MTRGLRVSVIVILVGPTPSLACWTPIIPGVNRTAIETVRVDVDPLAAAMIGGTSPVINGFTKWNQASCQSNQEDYWVRPFPVFDSTTGTGVVEVRRDDRLSSLAGANGDSCASITSNPHSEDDNATISLYTHIKGDNDQIFQCNWDSAERTALIIAHELGHYLGLNESTCQGSIMGGWDISWNSNTGIATFLAAGHAIRDYECQKADELSISPTESQYEEQTCLTDPDCDPYAPCWSSPGCTCPILLDLDRDDFQLASKREAVSFDIDNDGEPELVTWTRHGSGDAFLCWDRNGNGKIDNGSELFGNSTQLYGGGIAPFGYIALSELDGWNYGGNLDGLIDDKDDVYERLCVWTDSNQDGETDPWELQGLAEAGVAYVGVDWVTRAEEDATGNLFLYHGTAGLRSDEGMIEIQTTDVYFVPVDRNQRRPAAGRSGSN